MSRKLSILITVSLLLVAVALSAHAAGFWVHDDAQLMTASEAAQLEQMAQELSDRYDIDIVIHTTDSIGVDTARHYADLYYESNGYSSDGILMMISLQERDWYIYTSGKMIGIVDGYGRDKLLDLPLELFSDGEYFGGFREVLLELPNCMEAKSRPVGNSASVGAIGPTLLISAAIGAAAAGIVLLILRSGMNTRRKQRSAADYMRQDTYRVRIHQDMFLYSQVTKTPRQQSSSSGGSAHRSSGGRMHGGGGRKF